MSTGRSMRPVKAISVIEGSGRPKCTFAGADPVSEVGHSRQSSTLHLRDPFQARHHRAQQAPRMSGASCRNDAHSSRSVRRRVSLNGLKVRRIARSAKSARLIMSSMPLRRIGRTALSSISSVSVYSCRVANPPAVANRQSVSESQLGRPETLSKASRWPFVAAIKDHARPAVAFEVPRHSDRLTIATCRPCRFGRALLAGYDQQRIGPRSRRDREQPSDYQYEVGVVAEIGEGPKLIYGAATNRRWEGSIPAVRRKRTGGSPMIRQPA